MNDLTEDRAAAREQEKRMRQLYASVVFVTISDAVSDERKYGNGIESLRRWGESPHGRLVLEMAGVQPTGRVIKGLCRLAENAARDGKFLGTGQHRARKKSERASR